MKVTSCDICFSRKKSSNVQKQYVEIRAYLAHKLASFPSCYFSFYTKDSVGVAGLLTWGNFFKEHIIVI
jgi:hypothetical protein